MVETDSATQTFTKEEVYAAKQLYRKAREEKRAWSEDNENRKLANQPTRTLLQYKADMTPSPPPDTEEQCKSSSDKQEIPDYRQPQPDRLPKSKIPLARTESESKAVQRSQEQYANLDRPGRFASVYTTAAGLKRRAEHDDDSIPKRSRIEKTSSPSAKRSAAELDSGRAKRAKLTSFMDHLDEQAEKKAATTDGEIAASKTATADSNPKAGGKSSEPASKAKADRAVVTAKHVYDKKDGAKRTKANAPVESSMPATRPISHDYQKGEVKRSVHGVVSGAATIENKATVINTSKADPEIESGPTSDTKAEQIDVIAKSGPSPKRAKNQSAAASEKIDTQKSKTQNSPVTSAAARLPASVDSKEEQTMKKVTAAGPSDKTKSPDKPAEAENPTPPIESKQEGCAAKPNLTGKSVGRTNSSEKPAATGSVTPTSGIKRKVDDEVSGPAKKPKLEASKHQNSLYNYSRACFMNATLHLLHSIPNFAVLQNESDEATSADAILNQEEMRSAVIGRGPPKVAACNKQREHLKFRKESEELKLLPHLKSMMKQMSNVGEVPRKCNPFVFQQVCGTMFTGNEDHPMNGERNGDAHEFMLKLLEQVRKEQPELGVDELLAAQFAEQQVCECGARKTFIEDGCHLNIPEELGSRRMSFEDVLWRNLRDGSRFFGYRCEKCGVSDKWSTKDSWSGKRIIKSPAYLIAHVSRGQAHARSSRTGKFTNKIMPPMCKIILPSVNGSEVYYHLEAMIEHSGNSLSRGHYTTTRKVGTQWWYCDDVGRRGVIPLTRSHVKNHDEGCVFLLKKVGKDDPYIDPPTGSQS